MWYKSMMATVDWGNVPAWVGSLLTGTSVLAALTYYVYDKRDERQAQARLVSYDVIEPLFVDRTSGVRQPRTFILAIENSSPLPIYNVSAALEKVPFKRVFVDNSLLTPRVAQMHHDRMKRWFSPALPERASKLKSEEKAEFDFSLAGFNARYHYRPVVFFADSESRYWQVTLCWDSAVNGDVERIEPYKYGRFGYGATTMFSPRENRYYRTASVKKRLRYVLGRW